MCYFAERKEQQSIDQSLLKSNQDDSENGGELGSKHSEGDNRNSEHFNSEHNQTTSRPMLP